MVGAYSRLSQMIDPLHRGGAVAHDRSGLEK
jgi:hypothetical protein